ncbi:MAG: ATP-binding cassette domain-containing protein [Heliobacteriaceae bacterium]|jgi:peptide/nickel transport system ATP-binding protein/oligopeptide transport system ATP-binding protein|nr:ATP-binding cassette domain-containing protein [Heliobacteriaceae bacterium]
MSLVNIKDLFVEYKTGRKTEIIHAVNGVSVEIKKGEILAVAGESGCGKSTLAKAVMRLEPVKSGEIYFEDVDILKMSAKELQSFRQKAQMVFQNPYSSLNPKMKILDILKEPLQINTRLSDSEADKIVLEKIELAGLDASCLGNYPHEFSGGQRQRIAIARALVPNPRFIIADEPVSALDVSIQAQIINLIKDLKEKYNLTFVFISHDLSVIRYIADRVAIMYLGEIVEIGSAVFKNPKHPYTKALLSSVPRMTKNAKRIILSGDLPSPADLPQGCKFHTRCPYAMEKCRANIPQYTGNTHKVKCFLYE